MGGCAKAAPLFNKIERFIMTNLITDYDIQALVDDELNDDDAELVMLYILENKWARERYAHLTAQKRLLKVLPNKK
ncbi:MAG: hypothetical protein VX803_04395 [Pseudomonadota bacterium]|jgi:anti-sigma factor RsiW|nr:hypothetical protein [Pseudomonadota bacterium]MEC9235470.1 hypothetical protein [Pseudomonadota bacterium]